MRRVRVYKDFLLSGLIHCSECSSFMTLCYTNKRMGEKLKRYYYYRCTSTFKGDWSSCSIKQVSADRLENFVLNNLERISLDSAYIENLVFRLNNDPGMGYRSGLELTEAYSPLSPQMVQNSLQGFLKTLAQQKGVERNLLIKKIYKGHHLFKRPNSDKSLLFKGFRRC